MHRKLLSCKLLSKLLLCIAGLLLRTHSYAQHVLHLAGWNELHPVLLERRLLTCESLSLSTALLWASACAGIWLCMMKSSRDTELGSCIAVKPVSSKLLLLPCKGHDEPSGFECYLHTV